MHFLEIDLDKNPTSRPKILKPSPGISFNAADPDHCASYLHFLQQGKWSIKFEPEWPCTTVPATIERKLALRAASMVVHLAGQSKSKMTLVSDTYGHTDGLAERVTQTGQKIIRRLLESPGVQLTL